MKLSIVIPCYNESIVIKENALKVIDYMRKLDVSYELIFVNDGSKDDTGNIIKSIPGVIAGGYQINRGKGGAVKEGIELANGDFILIMDADLSTDLSAIEKVIPMLKEDLMIVGSRKLKESVLPIKRTFKRRLMSWVCSLLVKIKFHLPVKDSQCGFKVLDKHFAKDVVKRQIINRFAFDVEYLYMAKLNHIEIKEIPVTWTDDYRSSVSPVSNSKEFLSSLKKIKKNKKNYIF